MDIEKIIKLIDAGFSKDDIIQLNNAAGAAEKPQESVKPEPEPVIEEPVKADPMADLLAEIKGLRADMQAHNINNDKLQFSNTDKAVDILGSIINPPTKK